MLTKNIGVIGRGSGWQKVGIEVGSFIFYPNSSQHGMFQTFVGIKLANNYMIFFCPERALVVWAPVQCCRGRFPVLPQWDSHVCGHLSGPPSIVSIYHLPVVYLLFKFKPGLPRPPLQIILHVGCPQALSHPGVTNLAPIVSILPRFNNVKSAKRNNFTLKLICHNQILESFSEKKNPYLFCNPKWCRRIFFSTTNALWNVESIGCNVLVLLDLPNLPNLLNPPDISDISDISDFPNFPKSCITEIFRNI